MSSRGGSRNSGGGLQSIPSSSRKMVQSLKEIVNCPEQEIYAMLKECNMDPNETVNRLLSQDPFHEVKSKREKKKETKETTESRSRGVSSTSNRGNRGATDRYTGRSGSTQFSVSEFAALHGKPVYKKENGINSYTISSSLASGMAGNNMNRRPQALSSDSITIENKGSTTDTVDGISLSSQPSSGYQSAWLGVPGQVSMADIVKMGRPHGKTLSTSYPSHHYVDHNHVQAPLPTASHHDLRSSEDHASKVSEITFEPGVGAGHHVSPNDEWPLVEQPPATIVPSVVEPLADSELHANQSNMPFDRSNWHSQSQTDTIPAQEDGAVENLSANHVGSASVSGRKMQEDNRGASHFDNDLNKKTDSYQPHGHAFEHQEVEDVGGSVSSVTANLQQLNIQKEDWGPPPEEDNPSVVIPSHLQVQTADCSHLSFGSFGSGINAAAFSGPFASMPLKSNLEEEPADADTSSIGHLEARNPEYYGDEPLRTVSDGNLVNINSTSVGSFDSSCASQPEVLKQEHPEATHGDHYSFPSSTPGYSFENSQQLNTGLPHQTSSQMHNLAPFSSVMQAYTNSLPSTLLAATVQPVRESDLPYSPFPITQSPATKYGNTVSSISGSTIPISEALKTSNFSNQPSPHILPGSSVATEPALPQQLAMHPYSQPTLPLGPFANMISYPFFPQSYTYMSPAFQQAFAGNSTYHQSLAAVLPQYKNSVSVSSLPQSAAIASGGYGAFGSSTSIPGNFPMNPPTAPAGTTISYDDVLSSRYKDSSHLIALQQNENSGMWVHGPGSRTMPAVPASTYYNIQSQNQQPVGFRQGQQPSQNNGALGYPNFYHSQSGMSHEHHQQNPRDGSLGGSQGQPSKQSQQIWQTSY